jgi:hypothetical protein
VDEYNQRQSLAWDGYKCDDCWKIFDENKEIALLPLPPSTIVGGQRYRCSCGAWYGINPSTVINRDGKCMHVAHFHKKCVRCSILDSLKERYDNIWHINEEFFLDSVSNDTNLQVFKFCYDPSKSLVLFSQEGELHKDTIAREYGEPLIYFDRFVRGIYFRDKKIIYLRMHEDEGLLYYTESMLKFCGMPRDISVVWGRDAASELQEDLRGL